MRNETHNEKETKMASEKTEEIVAAIEKLVADGEKIMSCTLSWAFGKFNTSSAIRLAKQRGIIVLDYYASGGSPVYRKALRLVDATTTDTKTIEVGQRVWNNGDDANPAHWGSVTVKRQSVGACYCIVPDSHEEIGIAPYWVDAGQIHHVDNGDHTTRVVTMAAREARLQAYQNDMQTAVDERKGA